MILVLLRQVVLFSIAAGAGLVHAASVLTASPAAVALTCDTANGPGPAALVVVKPAAALTTNSIAVTLGAVSGGVVVTSPGSTILNAANQAQGLSYSISLAPGCAGLTTGTATVRFNAGGVADVVVTVTASVSALASALTTSPILFNCVRNAGPPASYVPGPPQSVLITSAATGGTPFTVDPTSVPAWLAVSPATGGLASAAGVPLILAALAPCGNFAAGSSNTVSIHLRNAPAPDGLLPVTLQVVGPTPLVVTPAALSLSYIRNSHVPGEVDVSLSSTASPAPVFTVDPSSLPSWLTVDSLTGVTPMTLHFTTTSVADSIAPGTYGAGIRLQVSGAGDLSVPVRLTVGDPPPKLVVEEGNTRNIVWTAGQVPPVVYVTLASTSSPIPYAISTAGPLAPVVGAALQRGFAYSSGTPIPVTFSPNVLAAANPGDTLNGTLTVVWGQPSSTTTIAIILTVQPAMAVLQAAAPSNLPVAAPGQMFTVALTGTGFNSATVAGIVSGGTLATDANIAALVVNPSHIILTITVPATPDPLLPFAPGGPGGVVTLGVCNGAGSSPCTTATGTIALTINPNPVIQAITSASAFLEVSPPSAPTVAPYDMVSLFGAGLCGFSGNGCASDQVLYGTPDPVTLRYPVALSPDPPGAGQRQLSVTFQTHATPPVLIDSAPLLFASNGQINLLVPSSVSAYASKQVDVVVSFGSSTATASSAPFPVNVATADPGIFTVGTDGQGDGAILAADGSLIAPGNEAGLRRVPSDSDTVQIYMTGLGAPDSTADNAASGAGQWPQDCVSMASFLSALNLQTSASSVTLDGALVASSALNTKRLPPCLRSPTSITGVTIGGQPAVVLYAGWVPDQVAGLYQLNIKLPGSAGGPFTTSAGALLPGPLTGPAQLPVVVTARGRTSQSGVTVWVAPRLKVTGLSAAGLNGVVGVAWSAGLIAASEGTAPYRYTVTGGVLPAGLVLNASTGAISGIPSAGSAGSYAITVGVTDAAVTPLTGSVS
jgi:uncharacterized protein (TIGR03437 family)